MKDSDRLDELMDAHFSDRADVPQDTKYQLRRKLYAAQEKKSARIAWLTVGAIILFALMIFMVTLLFGGYELAIILAFTNVVISGAGSTALTVAVRKYTINKEERNACNND